MKNIVLIEKETIICLDLKQTFKSFFPDSNITIVKDLYELSCGYNCPDLVIMDCHSIKQSNFKIILNMLGNAFSNAVPVILCHSGSSSINNFSFLNVIGDFQKPFSSQKLVEFYKSYTNQYNGYTLNHVA